MNSKTAKKRAHPRARTFRRLRRYSRIKNLMFSAHASFWIIIGGFALIIIGLFFFLWQESFSINTSIQSDKVGQFGDFIGGIVGSIWALSGVILFYVALSLQRKEFQLQRQELRETRNIFEQQATQMKTHQKESTFFNLLNHHNQTVLNITEKESAGSGDSKSTIILTGNHALRSIWNDLKSRWKYTKRDGVVKTDTTYSTLLSDHPHLNLSKHDSFRQIYYSTHNLLVYIKNHLDNDPFYIQILLNNLSKEEKEIISTVNEYGLYSDLDRIDFRESSLNFDVDLYNSDWFIPASEFPPRIKIEINDVKNPPNKIGNFTTVKGLIVFNDEVEFIDYGINNDGVDTKLGEFNSSFQTGQNQEFPISPEVLEQVAIKNKTTDVFGRKTNSKLYFNILFNGSRYRIVNYIHYSKNQQFGENFHF